MARYALLIGAQTGGLTGVDHDVSSMSKALAAHGFAPIRCEGDDATRDGILRAYQDLTENATAGDAVLVYYSGHGGYIPPPPSGRPGSPEIDVQFIVPMDYRESTEDDFRGITSIELSTLLTRLTQRTRNVVVALDCCHAAHMSRDTDLLPRALPRPASEHSRVTYDSVREHIKALPHRERSGWHPLGNRDAVRVVACSPAQSAYEYTNDRQQRTGILTESLVEALREFGPLPVSWQTVIERVRRRVLMLVPNQRPEVEGPSRRLLFSEEVPDSVGALPAVEDVKGRIRLDGAPLLGVEVGDEFAIMPAGAAYADDATKVGIATVDRVASMTARAAVRFEPGWRSIPAGAQAYRTKAAAPALPVRLAGRGARTGGLADAIGRSALLRVAEPEEPAAVSVLVDADDRFTVRDHAGPLHEPRPAGMVGTVVKDLERVARATALRTLEEDPRFALREDVTVEWGRVGEEGIERLPESGAVLHVGERVYVRIHNGGHSPVYVSLIDIGVALDITVLTAFDQSGVRLRPGDEYVYGDDRYEGTRKGEVLGWPGTLDQAQARPETILVLVTSAPQDVAALQQTGVRGTAPAASAGSPLDRAMAQVRMATRDLVSVSGPAVTYTVRTIAFDLLPSVPPPADECGFEIDERPAPELRVMSRSVEVARPTVAVRLAELRVHHNRAWRGADVRLDAVVLTGHNERQAVYRAHTERFSRIRDGQSLPLERMLLYLGPAVDFLDLAIWVSRDTTGSLALSDLLREHLTSVEFQEAGAQLLALTSIAPHAGMLMATAGAAAVVINTAYRLLSNTVGQSIGLYRTSLLASERFGEGRHPTKGVRRAQDFSFAYTVETVR